MNPSSSDLLPLVAVVTPVYNGAAFVAQTMDAVQAQTYGNLLHIVLDNASTDATNEILSRYIGRQVPVAIERNPRMLGIGANWNAAIKLIPRQAKYFRILCADDLIDPTFISRTVELAEKHPEVVVVGCRVRHRGREQDVSSWGGHKNVFDGKEAVWRFFTGKDSIIAHQTIIRCSELDRRKPFFDESLAALDTDACLDMLCRGDWGFVHETLATTRDHPATYSRAIHGLMLDSSDYLVLIERHASFAFGREQARSIAQLYRRYYLRQLLRWRLRGAAEIFDQHIAAINAQHGQLRAWYFLDALVDWPLARLGIRPTWPAIGGAKNDHINSSAYGKS